MRKGNAPVSYTHLFISSGGLGTMGFGMGAAIGAYAGTGERTVLVTGDGSFGTVSYTHLDVYKRQAFSGASSSTISALRSSR